MGRWRSVGVGALALVLVPGVVSAHELGASRFDAPIPLHYLFAGAGVTVGVTAVWLATRGAALEPPSRRTLLTVSPGISNGIRMGGRLLFLGAFFLALASGVTGPQVRAENIATVFVWPVWLKGVGLAAALFGCPWRTLSPWRTLYVGLTSLEGDDIAVLGSYPAWLAEWPALVGFLVWIGILENLTVVSRSPWATTVVVAGYATLMVVGAVAFGPTWFDRADALAVLYRLFGRVAPLPVERLSDGQHALTLRPPWQASTEPVRDLVVAGFVIATVYTVSFDGFTSTPEFQNLQFAARNATGLGQETSVILYVAGFLLFLVAFGFVVLIADSLGGADSRLEAVTAFAPTVLPIAVAYEIAHNYPYVLDNLGQLVHVVGAYFTASPPTVAPLAWLSLPAFWASQVVLIIGGHIVAVVASHYVSTTRYATRNKAIRAHVPITVLMVGYTVLSLWIISRPIVSG